MVSQSGRQGTPRHPMVESSSAQEVEIRAGKTPLEGTLAIPDGAAGLVLFAHGSGSSRQSPRNGHVARVLQQHKIGTLLFDLLTREEESIDETSGALRFDIPFLARRLLQATQWVTRSAEHCRLKIGYFGASTGAAAALVAAAEWPDRVCAIVSRGGRPDLAAEALGSVRAPTLLIVGGNDRPVTAMNEQALGKLRCERNLVIVRGATHLFEEPGTLEEVARLAAEWFKQYLSNSAEPNVSTPAF